MNSLISPAARLSRIALARQQVIEQGTTMQAPLVESWIERSWKRCLAWGHTPSEKLAFDAVSRNQIQHLKDANQPMLQAAKEELDRLNRAIAGEVAAAVKTWRDVAKRLGLNAKEIDFMASAFEHEDLKKAVDTC